MELVSDKSNAQLSNTILSCKIFRCRPRSTQINLYTGECGLNLDCAAWCEQTETYSRTHTYRYADTVAAAAVVVHCAAALLMQCEHQSLWRKVFPRNISFIVNNEVVSRRQTTCWWCHIKLRISKLVSLQISSSCREKYVHFLDTISPLLYIILLPQLSSHTVEWFGANILTNCIESAGRS